MTWPQMQPGCPNRSFHVDPHVTVLCLTTPGAVNDGSLATHADRGGIVCFRSLEESKEKRMRADSPMSLWWLITQKRGLRPELGELWGDLIDLNDDLWNFITS